MSLSFCLLDVVSMPHTIQTARRVIRPYSPPLRSKENKTISLPPRIVQDDESDDDNIDNLPPFKAVSRNLIKNGTFMTIDDFLQSSSEIDVFDVPYHVRENRETSPTPPPALPSIESKQPIKPDGHSKMQCVAQLHHTCQRVFGKTDMLKFEFIEVDGPNSVYCMAVVGFPSSLNLMFAAKRCILTITRPNGARRSYQTPGVYSRKNEAKSQTASVAIEMGAIDFITTGDIDPSKVKRGLVLAPLDATDEGDSVVPEPEDPGVQEIEDCCVEWRAGRVKPYWVALNEPKFGTSACHLVYPCNQKLTVQNQNKAVPFASNYRHILFECTHQTQHTRPSLKLERPVQKSHWTKVYWSSSSTGTARWNLRSLPLVCPTSTPTHKRPRPNLNTYRRPR